MGNKKKTTIKDIANVLGLTPSAVSKALNDHPRISDKTKNAVREVAKDLNYQLNHLASALRKGKSNLIGVIIPRANSNFFSTVVENMERVLNDNGYNVIMTQSNESYKKECRDIDALIETQVDGIIASIATETSSLEHYKKIKQKGIPLVLFDRGDDKLDVDYVGINDFKCSFEIVNHLVENNCKRIAHIAGYGTKNIYEQRILGYKKALIDNGIDVDEKLIIQCNLKIEDGKRITEELLEMPKTPDAIYAAGDYAALGALQVLQDRGIKVPEEVAIFGFSNEPFTLLTNPPISTVDQQSNLMGELVAEAFLKRVKDTKNAIVLSKTILNSKLIIRESSQKNN